MRPAPRPSGGARRVRGTRHKHAMMRRTFLLGFVTLTIVVGMVAAGTFTTRLVASRDGAASGAPEHEAELARIEARLFFDNPFERMAMIEYAVIDHRVTPYGPRCRPAGPDDHETESGLQQVVAAYTLFGLEVSRVLIECDGFALRMRPGETLAQAAER